MANTSSNTSVRLSEYRITAGETATLTITFSEAVPHFTEQAIEASSLLDGDLGGFTASDDQKTWTSTFTPGRNVHDTKRIIVNLGQVTDAQGRSGSGTAESPDYTVNTMPPVLSSATFTSNIVLLRFTGAAPLDEKNDGRGEFLVSVDGAPAGIPGIRVNAMDKTITLSLVDPVTSGQTVKISCCGLSDNHAIQDIDGNQIAAFTDRPVTFKPDTTLPVIGAATVNGRYLMLSCNEATFMDDKHPAPSNAFTVLVDGVPDPVTSVDMWHLRESDGSYDTFVLILTRAVTPGQTVTLAYTAPSTGNAAIQDVAGNHAASFAAMPVTNNTTLPVIGTATVHGDKLVLSYTGVELDGLDSHHTPHNAAFVVKVAGEVNDVTHVDVDVWGNVTLTLTRPVTTGQSVTVAYNAPSTDDAIQSFGGNRAASFAAMEATDAPVLSAATVYGDQLVLSYAGATTLDANHIASNSAFAVTTNGSANANAVTHVTVDATARTVTLTLTDAVPSSNYGVTVIYHASADDTNAIQDVAGHHAANFRASSDGQGSASDRSSLTIYTEPATTKDTTPPVINCATVSGNQLMLGYTEATYLDSTHRAPCAAFTVLADGQPNPVTAVAMKYHALGLTLTLAHAVTAGQRVSIAYAAPATGDDATRDAAGNRAASFAAMPVTNDTANTTWPIDSITLADRTLAAGKTTTVKFNFNQRVSGFTTNDIDFTHANGTPGPLIPDATGQIWSTTLTPTPDTESSANFIGLSDAAQQSGAGHGRSGNYIVDTKAPVLARATVTGDQLVLGYTEGMSLDKEHTAPKDAFKVHVDGTADTNLDAVTAITVDEQAKTVTLTLASAVSNGQSVKLAYTDPTTGDDAIQDAAGNDAASFTDWSVNNQTPAHFVPPIPVTPTPVPSDRDSTPPVINSATVNGDQLVLRYTEANKLDDTHKAAPGDFTVLASGQPVTVRTVAVDAAAKTVTLTLNTPVTADQSVSVAYVAPGTDNAIQDAAHNHAAGFPTSAVGNHTPPPPVEPIPIAPAPTPATPDTDKDKDGQPSAIEDQAPGLPGPDGATPVVGDGNGDGIQDSTQAAVNSASIALSPTGASDPAGVPTTFVTLVDGSQDGKVNPDSDAHITSLVQKDAPAALPQGMQVPIGLLHFEATQTNADSSQSSQGMNLSLYVDPTALSVNGIWVHNDSTGVWENLASAPYGGKMVMEGDRLRLDFHLAAGEQFDADGKADGVITVISEVAVAHMPLSIVGQGADVGHLGFWF